MTEHLTISTIPVYVEDWDRLAASVMRGPVDSEQGDSFVFIHRTLDHLNGIAGIRWDITGYYAGRKCAHASLATHHRFEQPPRSFITHQPVYDANHPDKTDQVLWGLVHEVKSSIISRQSAEGTLYDVAQAAQLLGISASRVRRLAESRGVGHRHGKRAWAFTAAEIAVLQDRKPGRPSHRSDNSAHAEDHHEEDR